MLDSIWQKRYKNPTERMQDIRDPYQIDRGRIVHSQAFRRLQNKTQVYKPLLNDFFRGRLTHSLEVAQNGTGLCCFLRDKYKDNQRIVELLPNHFLMDAICYAHDIGHPPYGHGGEEQLNCILNAYGLTFEGNAQTLRVVSHIERYTEESGIGLTRRTLLGLLKYPALMSQYIEHTPEVLNKGIYDEDSEIFDWILEPLSPVDKKLFTSLTTSSNTSIHPSSKNSNSVQKTIYKSFDCSLMDMSDDITYAVHDIEDSIKLGTLTYEHWVGSIAEFSRIYKEKNPTFNLDKFNIERNDTLYSLEDLATVLFKASKVAKKRFYGTIIYYLISNVEIVKQNLFAEDLLDYTAVLKNEAKFILAFLKQIVRKNIIENQDIKGFEKKGREYIQELFEFLIIPENLEHEVFKTKTFTQEVKASKNKQEQLRIISDYISSLSNIALDNLVIKLGLVQAECNCANFED